MAAMNGEIPLRKATPNDKLYFRFSFDVEGPRGGSQCIIKEAEMKAPDGITPTEFWAVESVRAEELTDRLQAEIDRRRLEYNYGVHDFSGQIKGAKYEWGYNTYEVERGKIDELIAIWVEILTTHGFEVGQMIEKVAR